MSFKQSELRPDEELVLHLRPHWWYMAPVTLVLVGAIALALLILAADVSFLNYLGAILIVAALVWWVARFAKWYTTHFVLTSDRLIYRRGIISRSGTEIPLDKVNIVLFHQSIFERIFGLGSIKVESASESGSTDFGFIRKPSAVQNAIYHQIERNEHADIDRMAQSVGDAARDGLSQAGGPPSDSSASVPEQIAALDELRTKGILSEEEFQAKKAQLLDRM